MKALKLVQAEDVYDINGGIIIQPGDVPQECATVAMLYADLITSDKVILLPTGYKEEMEVMLPALADMFGGKEASAEKPRCISLINTVSPLSRLRGYGDDRHPQRDRSVPDHPAIRRRHIDVCLP